MFRHGKPLMNRFYYSSKAIAESEGIRISRDEQLIRWASERSHSAFKGAAAGNRHAPADILAKLSMDKDPEVRAEVAGNPITPAELLLKLAGDKAWFVRYTVAGNANTPRELIARFASDPEYPVRIQAARRAEGSVLAMLARDPDYQVRKEAAYNRNATQEILQGLWRDGHYEVRAAIREVTSDWQ